MPISRSLKNPSQAIQRNRVEFDELMHQRQSAGISSLQIAATMQTAYPYLRLVERGFASVTTDFLSRYRDALDGLLRTEAAR